MTTKDIFPQPICERIWKEKYRFEKESINGTFYRIAESLAEDHFTIDKYYKALEDFKFIPAGRIIAGAGTKRDVTLFNCFVMGTIPDSMEGIFESLKEAAITMQKGGGIGYDFSTLRPKGAMIKGVGSASSGPLSFMDTWDSMCSTIMSAGSRRGAMMGVMRVDHPDILSFIKAKKDPLKLRKFNLSVTVTDKFMEAVKYDKKIALVHKEPRDKNHNLTEETPRGREYVYERISASEIWNEILQNTYNHAEPGIIFIDRVNKENNLKEFETLYATNPCAEQPLPPYGACLLGSLNIYKFVNNPFSSNKENSPSLNWNKLEDTIKTAVQMLDAVINSSKFPLIEQAKEEYHKRRMGLGITGLADTMFAMGIRYGSDKSAEFTENLLKFIAIKAYEESASLAVKKGKAPVFDKNIDKYVETPFIKKLPVELKEKIKRTGLRNSHILSVAPTGTISLMAGNVSSGIEPIFSASYTRKTLNEDNTYTTETIESASVKDAKFFGIDENSQWWKDYMVTAMDGSLTPEDHIKILSVAQKWIDSSISKTINCPETISFDNFKEVYMKAYKSGCKSCATYRPNKVTGAILTDESSEKVSLPIKSEKASPEASQSLSERPEVLEGMTYKARWKGDPIYITFNHQVLSDGKKIPFEIFIRSKKPEHDPWVTALTRTISAIFRKGGDITFIMKELDEISDYESGQFRKTKYVKSLPALIGKVFEEYLQDINYISTPEEDKQKELPMEMGRVCSQCRAPSLVKKEGCWSCMNCGHSACE